MTNRRYFGSVLEASKKLNIYSPADNVEHSQTSPFVHESMDNLPSLEVHIPISSNPLFFNMVHYLVRSLRMFGSGYSNAKVVLTIGEPSIDPDIRARVPWLDALGVEVNWVPVEKYSIDTYYATALERFLYRFSSDMVLMLDADILVAGSFEWMITETYRRNAIGGLIAHTPPFREFSKWQSVYDACGLGAVIAENEHAGWGYMFSDPSLRFCPPYFNLGVIVLPAKLASQIGNVIFELMHDVCKVERTMFRCQIALSLAITMLKLSTFNLPITYNFPNDRDLEAMSLEHWSNAAILHLLRENQGVYKDRLFHSVESVEEMLNRNDLRCINAKAQAVLAAIHPIVLQDPRSIWSQEELETKRPLAWDKVEPNDMLSPTPSDQPESQQSHAPAAHQLGLTRRVARRLAAVYSAIRYGHS